MFTAITLSVLLAALSVFLHYAVLRTLNDLLPRLTFIRRRARVLVAMFGAMGSHVAHIAMFAFAYYLLQSGFGLGGFGGAFQRGFSNYLYFSAETYTSFGFGDIVPLGQLRLVVGLGALTGLLMISWTASFTYLEMSRDWNRS